MGSKARIAPCRGAVELFLGSPVHLDTEEKDRFALIYWGEV